VSSHHSLAALTTKTQVWRLGLGRKLVWGGGYLYSGELGMQMGFIGLGTGEGTGLGGFYGERGQMGCKIRDD